MVNGKIMTVVWHIDDLQVSHKEKINIRKFYTYLSNTHRKKPTVKRVNVHDYLGIDLKNTQIQGRRSYQ